MLDVASPPRRLDTAGPPAPLALIYAMVCGIGMRGFSGVGLSAGLGLRRRNACIGAIMPRPSGGSKHAQTMYCPDRFHIWR